MYISFARIVNFRFRRLMQKCDLSHENVPYGICVLGGMRGKRTDEKRVDELFYMDTVNGYTDVNFCCMDEVERLHGCNFFLHG